LIEKFKPSQRCFGQNVTRFGSKSLFRRKRDTFLLFHECFNENVARFGCFKIFRPKRGAFLLPQKYFSKKIVGMSGNGLQKKAI
jgi:hypothetical protein